MITIDISQIEEHEALGVMLDLNDKSTLLNKCNYHAIGSAPLLTLVSQLQTWKSVPLFSSIIYDGINFESLPREMRSLSFIGRSVPLLSLL